MRAIRSFGPRVFKGIVPTLGLTYLLLLHYGIYASGSVSAAEEVCRFTDSLFVHMRDAIRVKRCPLHHSSVLYEAIAKPAEIPAPIRLIYRRATIEYCGYYMSSLPMLDELPFPGIFYPDTLSNIPSNSAIQMPVCDECQRIALIYLEPHLGVYLDTNSQWRFPNYSLISPPTPSPPRSSRSIAARF